MEQAPFIEALFTGQPKALTDERGTWVSSIARDRVTGPVPVAISGLAGDKVAQPYHGGPGAAICVHLSDHYRFWKEHLGLSLEPGSVGENLSVKDLAEDEVYVGDRVRLGTVLAEVSGPRVPCANLARRIGRADWVKQTILENRTGFYLRVLEEGTVQAGDPWLLEARQARTHPIPAINRCMYLEFDPAFARGMLDMPGLEAWWKEQAAQKLADRAGHWTATMKSGGAGA